MKAKEERVERSPNWQDHLSQLVNMSADITTPFGGRKTMRRQEMDSQNKRHTQSISSQEKMQGASIASQEGMHGRGLAHDYRMHAETLAFRKEIEREKLALDWAEFEAAMKSGGGLDFTDPNLLEEIANESLKAAYGTGSVGSEVSDAFGQSTRDQREDRSPYNWKDLF